MRNNLLALLTIFSFCLPLIASDNMCLRFKDGKIITYSVSDIEEVFFCDSVVKSPIVDSIPLVDTVAVDTSNSILEFTILTDSTAEVKGIAYGIWGEIKEKIVVPSKVLIEGKMYTVTSIKDMAFYFTGVTSIEIPSTIAHIGELAFAWCSKMTDIKVASDNSNYCTEDGVLYNKDKTVLIHASAKKKGHFMIPSSVVRIEKGACHLCRDMTGVTFPSNLKSIGVSAFMSCDSLRQISIPAGVSRIDTSAFQYCLNLISVEIPYTCDIEIEAFGECPNLKSVKLPSNLSRIGRSTFRGCSSLTNINIPSSVTSIGVSAFQGCSSLTDVVIPYGVTNIDDNVFEGCSSLTDIEISSSVTRIGHEAFSGCINLDVVIDNAPYEILLGIDPFLDCKSVTYNKETFVFDESDQDMPLIFDGPYYWSDSTVSVEGVKSYFYDSESIIIPAKVMVDGKACTVTRIQENAFSRCGNLKDIKIPMTVESIDDFAFDGCGSLETVFIPSSVTYIASDAFANCHNIDVVIDNSRDNVYIDEHIFSQCKSVTFIK